MGETHSEFCIVQKKGSKHKVCLDSVRPPGIFFWCMFLNGGGESHCIQISEWWVAKESFLAYINNQRSGFTI